MWSIWLIDKLKYSHFSYLKILLIVSLKHLAIIASIVWSAVKLIGSHHWKKSNHLHSALYIHFLSKPVRCLKNSLFWEKLFCVPKGRVTLSWCSIHAIRPDLIRSDLSDSIDPIKRLARLNRYLIYFFCKQ